MLRDAEERPSGALIVLSDMTELRRLENVRRDFVANVSHEIKTPVTSIRLAVETLQSGAMNSAKDRERFLNVIQRHAGRLETLIEDLLRLSRLEQEEGREGVEMTEGRLRPVLEAALRSVEIQAQAREVHLELACPEGLTARLHPALIEQAVVNLLDNAVKHSPAGGTVRLSAAAGNEEAVIEVQDQGPGIDPVHHARLFERFYRVDKARSRQQGGTGLGLAIVKHIAQAHRGRVSVESAPGRGSTFRLHLPLTPPRP
jgi:two-component system phosphate regulon sensor histidine kinase PhoR